MNILLTCVVKLLVSKFSYVTCFQFLTSLTGPFWFLDLPSPIHSVRIILILLFVPLFGEVSDSEIFPNKLSDSDSESEEEIPLAAFANGTILQKNL